LAAIKLILMKKLLLNNILPLLLLAAGFYSCCKHPEDPGNATLVIRLKHHGTTVPNHISHPDTVWIKYNVDEAPPSVSDYDKFIVGEGTEDHIHVENISCGKLFLYGAGLDSSSGAGERVVGGQAIKIKHKNRKKETEVDLAVAE
jgi:hypothetical protein